VTPTEATPFLADPLLALAADVLDDLETVRVANENRLRQLTRTDTDSDDGDRGFGLPLDHPDVACLAGLVDGLARAEHQAELQLCRLVRAHPLGPWIARSVGVGEKQGARLLAAVGDPYWNTRDDRPRRVSDLRSYCGYGDAATQVRRRGHRVNWSPTAKMRTFLVAEKCVQAGKARNTSFYQTYAAARVKYADAVHKEECRRCGPSGAPALPGSPLSAKHQHHRGLRAVSKAILLDLWREARYLHGDHDTRDDDLEEQAAA